MPNTNMPDVKTSENIKKMINNIFKEDIFDVNGTDQTDDESLSVVY